MTDKTTEQRCAEAFTMAAEQCGLPQSAAEACINGLPDFLQGRNLEMVNGASDAELLRSAKRAMLQFRVLRLIETFSEAYGLETDPGKLN